MVVKIDENEKTFYSYITLEMERKRVSIIPYNYSIIHQIDENSPLFKYSNEEIGCGNFNIDTLF